MKPSHVSIQVWATAQTLLPYRGPHGPLYYRVKGPCPLTIPNVINISCKLMVMELGIHSGGLLRGVSPLNLILCEWGSKTPTNRPHIPA